jgi:hypothetical protein
MLRGEAEPVPQPREPFARCIAPLAVLVLRVLRVDEHKAFLALTDHATKYREHGGVNRQTAVTRPGVA